MDKATEAREVDAILQRGAPTVQNWFEVHKRLLDGKLWEYLGFSSYSAYLDARPTVDQALQVANRVISIRRPAIVELTREGRSQQHIAKRLRVTDTTVRRDQRAAGTEPTGARHRQKKEPNKMLGSGDQSASNTGTSRKGKGKSSLEPPLGSDLSLVDAMRDDHEKEQIARMHKILDRISSDAAEGAGLSRVLQQWQRQLLQKHQHTQAHYDSIIRNLCEMRDNTTIQTTDPDEELRKLTNGE